jgi:hypothetical protein
MADVPMTLPGVGPQKLGMDVSPARLGLLIPPLTIQHSVDREQARKGLEPGTWTYRNHSLGEQVDVTFLKVTEVRQYDKREGKRRQTLCASADGRVPIPEIRHPKNDECETCPFSLWTDVVDEAGNVVIDPKTGNVKRKAPDCDLVYAFLGLVQERPFWYRSTTAKKNRANTQAFLRDFQADTEIRALFEWVVRLSLVKDDRFYCPVFEVVATRPFAEHAALFEQVRTVQYVPFLGRDVIEPEEDEPRDVTPPGPQGVPPPEDLDDIPF